MTLQDRLRGLSQEEKRALLGELLSERAGRNGPRREALSPSQERMWLLHQIDPAGTAYHLHNALRLKGPLDIPAMSRALNDIVARHEILRTTFHSDDASPSQVVSSELTLPLPLTDVAAVSPGERLPEVTRLAIRERRRPFDLSDGPLLRARLYRMDDEDHVLSLVIHHIVADGWSLSLLLQELARHYRRRVGGETDLLALPSFQYADFAAWQRRSLQGEVVKEQLAYWTNQLAGAPAAVSLPGDGPRSDASPAGWRSIILAPELTARLRDLARREGVTLFVVLLAAFELLLHRLSGQEDFTVGTPVAGRTRRETEELIGFFVNMLVLRADMSGNPSFRALLQRVRQTTLDALSRQDLPFERLLEEVRPDRDLTRTPLFNVYFNMLSFREEEIELPGLSAELLPHLEAEANFDLTLYAKDEPTGLNLSFLYRADLFTDRRIDAVAAQLEQVLGEVVADPERSTREFSLVTPPMRALLPDPTEAIPPSPGQGLLDRIAGQVSRGEQRPAVVGCDQTLSYGEIAGRAAALAAALRAHGVGGGDVVVVYASRSPALPWALLGVVEAGAAFCILDATLPPARLVECLQTARPRAWLRLDDAGEPAAPIDECLEELGVACRLRLPGDLPEEPPVGRLAATGADALGYVAFTSGTTGGLKGILGPHRPVTHFLSWYASAFDLGPDDRFAMLSGLGHDPLLRDVFTPLSVGATLSVPAQDDLLEPRRLRQWASAQQITVAHLTPALARVLTEGAHDDELPRLRLVCLGGDVLTRDLVRDLRRMASSATIVNFYGATETPQAMGWHVVPPDDDPAAGPVPLGRGIDGVQLLVLSSEGQLAGVGELGEIAIRTPHLAAGYLNDEELTRARFAPSPFATDPEDRVYRTGDLGRFLPDGLVEFCGRRDGQVKIRGYRVEPGEIEAALERHAAVRQAAVIARGQGDDKRLLAYVAGPPALGREDLRQHLLGLLPEYMVPSLFVALDRLPLTPNGKVDREALPEPEGPTRESGERVAPRTPLEEQLAGIWCEAIGIEQVGVHDDFFALGGHSLLATRVMTRVERAVGVTMPVRALFECPTIATLAARLARAGAAEADEETEPISVLPRADGRRGDSLVAPLSFSQERLWLLEQLASGAAYRIAGALELIGDLDTEALRRAIAALVARHESLRTTFRMVDDVPRQVIAAEGEARLELVADVTSAELPALVEDQLRRDFDLERGPLFRTLLVTTAPGRHVLLFVIHHIVSDGWSAGVFTRELSELYRAFRAVEEPGLLRLGVQYADFARWQRERLSEERLERELAHWRSQLEGAPQVVELPTDRPRPAVETHRGARLTCSLPPDLGEGLRELARHEGTTLYMALLAAFDVLLWRYTGQEDLLVGSPVANRGRPEIEGLIGCFVNTLVIRTDISGDPTFRELLSRVRETCLEAYAHQELPFERLVDELHTERDLSRNPLFQVMLVLQNAPMQPLELPGLTVKPMELDRGASQVDLTLYVRETPQGLEGTFEYATDLFQGETIQRLSCHLEELLRGIVARPEARVSELGLLRDAEREQLLVGWNQTRRDYPLERCLHELIEEQVARTPERVAVESEEGRLSYRELDRRSTQLAHRLRRLGVGPGARVGVALERSVELVVGLLGILRAGGAYVPVDPSYPEARVAYMLTDAQVPVLLTQERLRTSLPTGEAKVLALDLDWADIAQEPVEPLSSVATSDDLAYVIYTSGSTGRPKGAMNAHRGIVNRLLWMQEAYGLDADDTVLQKTPFSFDVSVWEFFWPLIAGARLVMARPEGHKDPGYLVRTIREKSITTMHFVPPMLQAFLDEPGVDECTSLRRVICSGEALPAELRDRFFERLECELHNLYGPTEAAVDVTAWECRRDHTERIVPIGRPVANTRVYVLDGRLEPQPVGVPGELYIGGVQVGRGYLGRPELTAERFVPDPFGEEPGARLYRTGDLARFRPDGSVEFLGRIDHQVKIRGFRIELGEIEAALFDQPAVREAVVVVREDRPGDARLVGYHVADGDAGRGELDGALRAALRARLPEYMVPSALVQLESLPLLGNGKVDRRALPAPDGDRRGDSREHVAPRNPAEEAMSRIWAHVLGTSQVSVEESFFDVGGNSMLLLQVVARARREGVELAPLTMFRYPTVRSLVEHLEGDGGGAPDLQGVRDRARRQREAQARQKRALRRG